MVTIPVRCSGRMPTIRATRTIRGFPVGALLHGLDLDGFDRPGSDDPGSGGPGGSTGARTRSAARSVSRAHALAFLKTPDITIIQALLLKFKPANMDVLPLYIVLLVMFPLALWLLIRNASLALAISVALYVLTWEYGWNFESYPSGHWFFNPLAWQLLFVFGAWCALGGATRLPPALRSPVTTRLSTPFLPFPSPLTPT